MASPYQPLTTEKAQHHDNRWHTPYPERLLGPGSEAECWQVDVVTAPDHKCGPAAAGPGRFSQETSVHVLSCTAPPTVLYNLVADVSRWAAILDPVIHVRYSGRSGRAESFDVWALVGGKVRSWRTRRGLDPSRGCITFEQEHTEPPVAEMRGKWEFQPLEGGGSRVELRHWFTVAGGDAERDQTVAGVDQSSTRDLAALCQLATLGHPVNELLFSFSDQVRLPVSAADAYSFVYRSDLWPEALSHVNRVALTEPQPGVQDMEMDSLTADGRVHATRSLRLCFPDERIVFKQLVTPALLAGHSGAWDFVDDAGGAVVTTRHTVAINPAAVAQTLGRDYGLADARKYLRDALSVNSRATLEHAGSAGLRAVGAGHAPPGLVS
ncbi:MAG: aromatase/cyclase [Actinobacteria bacterium]|nr:aromatase/cyclase [Actinomycetota bacterium]